MGVELWRSDGTDEGTVLVKDTHAGADSYISSDLVDVNGMIFFITYSPGSGYELWQSDGTEGGTVLIKGGFGWSSVDPFGICRLSAEVVRSSVALDFLILCS